MKLYEIEQLYVDFMEQIESGEIPEEAITDTLEAIEGAFDDKVDNIACVIKNYNAEIKALKDEETSLAERRKYKENRIERLKNYLSESMKRFNKDKIETSRNVISFRKSTALYIADEKDFIQRHPDLITREEVIKIPKNDITDLIKQGQEISGAEIVTNFNLQVK